MHRRPDRHPRIALALMLLIPTLSFAHSPQPAPGCIQPTRPPDKNDLDAWNRFMDQVDVYRDCMSTFITENNAAADRHRVAANAATTQWNAFVHGSLNVPEDFPWPLPDKEPD